MPHETSHVRTFLQCLSSRRLPKTIVGATTRDLFPSQGYFSQQALTHSASSHSFKWFHLPRAFRSWKFPPRNLGFKTQNTDAVPSHMWISL